MNRKGIGGHTLANNGRHELWLTPPCIIQSLGPWMEAMALHGNGIALTFARTETDFWHRWIWPFAKAVLFIKGRLNFYLPDGSRSPYNAGGPSCLIAYADDDVKWLRRSGIQGQIVRPERSTNV